MPPKELDAQAAWFALRVKPRFEKKTAHALLELGAESFVPLSRERRRWNQRWQVIEVPLFTGYVFSRFEREFWGRIMRAPGVLDVVRTGRQLAPVTDFEIASLRIAQHSGCPMTPTAYFEAGQQIQVDAGPLAGIRGQVVQDGGEDFLILSVDLLRRSLRVKIAREAVVAA